MKTSKEWVDLLDWLEKEGVCTGDFNAVLQSSSTNSSRSLVAIQDIGESTPILALPQSVLVHTKTIPKEFVDGPCSELSSTQALTLFLAVYRLKRRTSQDEKKFEYPFGCYLSTLPADFSEIPLVWLLEGFFEDTAGIHASDGTQLERLETHVRQAPPHAVKRLFTPYHFMTGTTIRKSQDVLCRFINDWSALLPILLDRYPAARLGDLLWAWLIVNTRCVSFDIGKKHHADNIVLAPAFDMANHSPKSKVTAMVTPHTLTMYSSPPRGQTISPLTKRPSDFSAPPSPSGSSSKSPCVRQGEEITFTYGPHSNATLLTEYGFITSEHNPWDSIDVTDQIVALFDPSNQAHLTKIELLKSTDYWEDYTIQCDPLECSHRNLVALRLLHTPEEQISHWRDHIDGLVDELDRDIEDAVQDSLDQLFSQLTSTSRQLLHAIELPDPDLASLGLSAYSLECLRTVAANEFKAISSYSPCK